MRERVRNIFSGRHSRRSSQATSPTGEPPSNDTSGSNTPRELVRPGAQRSVSEAIVTVSREQLPLQASIPRKPVPKNDLISPPEVGSGEGSSVPPPTASPSPILGSRRASHTGHYGDLHSGVPAAQRPTARAASTGRHASTQGQHQEIRGSHRGTSGGIQGGGGASTVQSSRQTSLNHPLPPPPPHTSDLLPRSDDEAGRSHRGPSGGTQTDGGARSLPSSRRTSLNHPLPPLPHQMPASQSRHDDETRGRHRGASGGTRGVGGASSLSSSRQASAQRPLPPPPTPTLGLPSLSSDETGRGHQGSSGGSQGGDGISSPSSSQRTVIVRPVPPTQTPDLVSLCEEDPQPSAGGRGASSHPSQSTDLVSRSLEETLQKRYPSMTDPPPPRPLPKVPEDSPPRTPTRLRPADQESVDLVTFSPGRTDPVQLASAEGVEGSGQLSSINVGDNSTPAVSAPNLQESPARPGRTYKYVIEDDSSSEGAAESSSTPSGPIPGPAIYRTLNPQGGTPTPRNASASGSPDISVDLPEFPVLQPTPITPLAIQTALAGFANSEDNGDGGRTPIAQEPSTPPFPDPDTPTLRTYKTEPPRTGPGFDGTVAPLPPRGAPNRSHLFVRPHRLSEDELDSIAIEYNTCFALNDATRESMLPQTYRYPEHARDEEALRRKRDFEEKTGETMSDDDFYSLFDQTTSTDGMLTTMYGFMEGRTWVKAPYVDRLIYQMHRMMHDSAQEEARLRHRAKVECDFLRGKLKDCEEKCATLREKQGLVKDRTAALSHITNSFQQVNDISRLEDQRIHENMGRWGVDSGEFSARTEQSYEVWAALRRELMDHLDEREKLEHGIEGGQPIVAEDLGRLREVDAKIQQHFHKTSQWMRHRSQNVIGWLKLQIDDVDKNDEKRVKGLLRDMHTEFFNEERFLRKGFERLRKVADLQHAQRELLTRPLIDVPEQVLPEPARSGSDIYESSLCANRDTSGQLSGSSGGVSGRSGATVFAQGKETDCAGCRKRDQQLREKDRTIRDQRNQLKVGFRKWAQSSMEAEQLRLALADSKNNKIADALHHIDAYRLLIFKDFRAEMGNLAEIFQMQVDRAQEHAARFASPIKHLKDGGEPDKILEELEAIGSSVESLAEASRVVQEKFRGQLDKMLDEHEKRFSEVTQQDISDGERQENLIRNLKKQVAELTRHAQGSLEHDAQESFRIAAALEKQMKAKINHIRDKVQYYKNEIRRRQKQCEADQSSTQSADPDLAKKLKKKEQELKDLEFQCRKAEQMIGKLESRLEEATEHANERNREISDLTLQVADLQLQLEERDETERWSLWDGTDFDVTDTSNPDVLRRNGVVQLQKALLEAVGKVETYTQSRSTPAPRVPSFTKRLQSLRLPKSRSSEQKVATETDEEDIKRFWRLVEFQRRRAEVVSLLRRNKFQYAMDRLGALRTWNQSKGQWHVESYAVEANRSLNYLQAYINVKLVPIQRQGDVLEVANETLETAKSCFAAAQKDNPDAEHDQVWMALRRYLELEVQKTVEELQRCNCKHKTRVCGMHEKNGSQPSYHHFMTVKGETDGDLELPESAFNSLDQHSRKLNTLAEE